MARQTLPDSVEKRNILHGAKTAPATLVAIGETYEQEGRLADALEFFVKAKHDAGLDRVKATAIEKGHSLLLLRVRRSGLREITPEEWLRGSAAATKAGRLQDALWCAEQSGDAERLEAVRELIRGAQPTNGVAAPATPPKPPI